MVEKNFFGIINCCEGFGRPQCLEVQVQGMGRFHDIGVRVRDYITERLKEEGFYTFRSHYSSVFQKNAGIFNKDEEEREDRKAHEKAHEKVEKAGFGESDNYDGLAFTYFEIFDESMSTSLGRYNLLNSPDNNRRDEDESSIKDIKMWGEKAYELARKVVLSPEPEQFEEEVLDFMSRSFCNHEDYNWLTLLMETKYFGLFGPCFEIISNNENHEELFNYGYELLLNDQEADEFIAWINSLTEQKREKLPVLFEKTVQKSLVHYRAGEEKFQIRFIAPFEWDITGEYSFLKAIEKDALEIYRPQIEELGGEIWTSIWANHLIIG